MKNNEEMIEQLKKSAIKIADGVSLRRAEIVLSQAKEQNINAYVVVYDGDVPINLYSLFEDVDDWYQKLVRMNKQEWTEFCRKTNEEIDVMIEEQRQEKIAKYASRVPEFIERGEKYIYPQKMDQWKELVNQAVYSDNGIPQVIDDTLNTMELFRMGVSYDEICGVLSELDQNHVVYVRNFILNYAKEGPAFIKAKFPEVYAQNKDYVDALVEENAKYQALPSNS